MPVGSSTSLTFTITNSNAATANTGVAFTDSLPAGLVVATPNGLTSTCGGTATAVAGSGSVSLSGSTIAANASCTVSLNVTGTTAVVATNSVTVTSNEGTGNTASATVTVTALLAPTITKAFGAASIPVSGTASLTFTVSNVNAVGSNTGVAFTDTLPAGLVVATPNGLTTTCGGTATAVAGSGSISLSGSLIAANTSCTVSLNVTGTSAGVKNNSVTVTSNEGTGNTSTATVTVTGAASSMTANAGTTPQSANVSTAFATALAVTVKDAGNSPVAGVNVTFTAPGAGAGGVFATATASITVATNASGIASAPFTANATAGGPYTVTAAAPGLTTVNFQLTNVAKFSATITVVSSLNPSAAGQAVTFTATVAGSSPTGSVTFMDGTATLGIATLSGGVATFATSSLSQGSHAITAIYGGDALNNGAISAVLTQAVNTPADSLKLRALQVLVTPMVAQSSGQAISSAVDSAISEGFSGGGAFIAPSGSGVRINFAADPDAQATSAAPLATDPFSSANGSFAAGARGLGSQPPSPSRIDDTFSALAYAGPTKAPPLRASEQKEWLGWAEVRGATLDHWGSLVAVPGASVLYGNQVNLLAGLTRKFTPNFLLGVLGGYETFDYRSDALLGRLKGDGWTVGSYLGWKITQGIRFDAGVAYSGIGYNGTAGMAAGSFNGTRWLVTGGLTGTYGFYGVQIEPSARVYALWEHENAYTDSLGTLQAARDFETGRASGGVKLAYPVAWSATVLFSPYVGLYGDYYFNADSAGPPAAGAIPFIVLDGWSARAIGGLTATFSNGAQVSVGGERGGIGSNFALWTYRARASVPFAAQ